MDPESSHFLVILAYFYAIYATLNIHNESRPQVTIAVYLAVTAFLWLTIPILVLAMVHRYHISFSDGRMATAVFALMAGLVSFGLASYRAYRIFKEVRRRSGRDPWGFD